MNKQELQQTWKAFQSVNHFRRAIRQFNATPIPEDDLYSLFIEASFAPSSGNMQPYALHRIRDPRLKVSMVQACHGQKAALSAAELIVIVASPELGKKTALAQLNHIPMCQTICRIKKQSNKSYF